MKVKCSTKTAVCAGHSKIFIDKAEDFTYSEHVVVRSEQYCLDLEMTFSKCEQFLTFCVLLKRIVASHEQMRLCMTFPECAHSRK